jgi:hypothetical protein
MKRWQGYIQLLTIVGLLAASGFQLMTIRNQQKIIDLEQKTIDMERAALENWKARAMACEDVVLSDDH